MKRIVTFLSCALLVVLAGCALNTPAKWVPVTLTAGTSTRSDVISFFGAEPDRYAWGTTTYTASTLPTGMYCMVYQDGPGASFTAMIDNNSGLHTVAELRIENSLKYRCNQVLIAGSTPTLVFAVVGGPTNTIIGASSRGYWNPDVFYQDMDGTVGYDYYDNSAHTMRVFFSQGKATALYVYGSASSLEMLK